MTPPMRNLDWRLLLGVCCVVVFLVASALKVASALSEPAYFAILAPIVVWFAYHAGTGPTGR